MVVTLAEVSAVADRAEKLDIVPRGGADASAKAVRGPMILKTRERENAVTSEYLVISFILIYYCLDYIVRFLRASTSEVETNMRIPADMKISHGIVPLLGGSPVFGSFGTTTAALSLLVMVQVLLSPVLRFRTPLMSQSPEKVRV
jgi:hypothetical protein